MTHVTLPEIGLLRPGKASVIIDGQFGSCGKGLAASYVGVTEFVEIAIATSSPNAGHTYYDWNGNPKVTRHLPVSALYHPRSLKYLCAGSIIDPELLLREIEDHDVDPSTLFIDPRAAVIGPEDVALEKNSQSGAAKIASTQKGVGAALARKVRRESGLAAEHPLLKEFVRDIDIAAYLDQGLSAVIEVPQGFGLALNSGLSYPHCTGREITVAQALSDAQLHPDYLGKTLMVVRAHPIRVGNLVDRQGNLVGESGPFYPDSREMTWDEIGVPPEATTVTRRVRRVASFSMQHYREAVRALKPDFVLLNFANYLKGEDEIRKLTRQMAKVSRVTHLGFGPKPEDVVTLGNAGRRPPRVKSRAKPAPAAAE